MLSLSAVQTCSSLGLFSLQACLPPPNGNTCPRARPAEPQGWGDRKPWPEAGRSHELAPKPSVLVVTPEYILAVPEFVFSSAVDYIFSVEDITWVYQSTQIETFVFWINVCWRSIWLWLVNRRWMLCRGLFILLWSCFKCKRTCQKAQNNNSCYLCMCSLLKQELCCMKHQCHRLCRHLLVRALNVIYCHVD